MKKLSRSPPWSSQKVTSLLGLPPHHHHLLHHLLGVQDHLPHLCALLLQLLVLQPSLSLLPPPRLMLHCFSGDCSSATEVLRLKALILYLTLTLLELYVVVECRQKTWPLVCFDISLEVLSLSLSRNGLCSPLSSWKVVKSKRNEKVKIPQDPIAACPTLSKSM